MTQRQSHAQAKARAINHGEVNFYMHQPPSIAMVPLSRSLTLDSLKGLSEGPELVFFIETEKLAWHIMCRSYIIIHVKEQNGLWDLLKSELHCRFRIVTDRPTVTRTDTSRYVITSYPPCDVRPLYTSLHRCWQRISAAIHVSTKADIVLADFAEDCHF